MSLTLVVTALGLVAATSAQNVLNFQPCPELNANITRSNGVEGTPFDCAQLSVPLDYTNPQSESLELDVFRVNATEEPVLGTVLINFGGPGGTGAENLPAWAEEARKNIGPQWHLVSWDPRGTGYTIPFRCDLAAVGGVDPPARKREVGTLVSTNLTAVFYNGGWDGAGQIAEFCAAQQDETAAFIGTAFVARDMIEIVDALGEDGLLRYYGWSYGTALGTYVAAMFPDRVDRIVLDANINPHGYQAGHYADFADDIDEAFSGFLETCFNVTDDCALYSFIQPNATQDLLDAINLALAPLAENATTSLDAYALYLTVKASVIQPLYFPRSWPTLAETLVALLNATEPEPTTPPAVEPYGLAANALMGIRASDATFIANSSDEYLPILEQQVTVSPGFSDIAYYTLWTSAQWPIPAAERYWGDFRTQTRNPILFVNGEFDPVTPLVNAYNASASFEGSVVLPHSGYGHGVFPSPSECVAGYVQAYFMNGTLPDADAYCEPDSTTAEVWRSVVQGTSDNSTSGEDGSSDSNTGETENGASREATGVVFAFAAVLAVAILNVL